MSPILQQLIQMNEQKKARQPRQGMNPMEALAKMIAQTGRVNPEDIAPQRPIRPDPYPEPVRPSDPVVEPDYDLPMMPNMPVQPMYPEPYIDKFQDSVGPLGAIGSAIGQQAQRRYSQDAMGNQVEIGYDGTPLANYTPDQMAIHNAIMGITPSQSRYVFNGEGYDLVPIETPQMPQMPQVGGVTLSNGQFIGGYENPNGGMEIGTPSFFQQYANNPDLMSALSDAYGYDVSNPDIVSKMQQQPQIGYNPEPNPNPEIGYNPDPNPVDGNKNSDNDFQKMMEDMRMQDRIKQTMEEIEPTRPNKQYDEPEDYIGRRLG